MRGATLQPVAELHTLRRAVRVSAKDDEAVEVVHDRVKVVEGTRVVREFDEVEIEQIRDGSERLIARLEKQLRAAGAKSSDGRPKVFQALGLPATGGESVRREAPAVEHLRAYLQAQVAALLRSDPVTRRGEGTGVHGMRVATRRMRSVLREARSLLDPGWVEETRSELTWLGGLLGDVRDSDVFAAYVRDEVARLGVGAEQGGSDLVHLISERSQPARARLAEALDSPRYLALLDRLEATRESLPVTPARESLRQIVRRATRRTLRRLRSVSRSSSDDGLHDLRIASKRARYAAELGCEWRGPQSPPHRQASRGPADDSRRASGRRRRRGATAEPGVGRDAGRSVRRRSPARAPGRSPRRGARRAADRGEALRRRGRSSLAHPRHARASAVAVPSPHRHRLATPPPRLPVYRRGVP